MIVRFHDGGSDLRSRGDGEGKFGFTAIIDRQTFQEKGTKTRASSTTSGVENHEALETGAVIGEFADTIQHQIDDFFANGVVTTGIVVGSIFLTGNELLRVVKLAVSTGTDFITHTRFQINKYGTRYVFARTSFREKRVEGIITTTNGFVGRHLTIRLDAVLQAVKLPACLK